MVMAKKGTLACASKSMAQDDTKVNMLAKSYISVFDLNQSRRCSRAGYTPESLKYPAVQSSGFGHSRS